MHEFSFSIILFAAANCSFYELEFLSNWIFPSWKFQLHVSPTNSHSSAFCRWTSTSNRRRSKTCSKRRAWASVKASKNFSMGNSALIMRQPLEPELFLMYEVMPGKLTSSTLATDSAEILPKWEDDQSFIKRWIALKTNWKQASENDYLRSYHTRSIISPPWFSEVIDVLIDGNHHWRTWAKWYQQFQQQRNDLNSKISPE